MPKKYTNCNSTLICLHSPFAIRQKDLVYTQKTLRKGKAYQRVSNCAAYNHYNTLTAMSFLTFPSNLSAFF